jgi:hypothetical protein
MHLTGAVGFTGGPSVLGAMLVPDREGVAVVTERSRNAGAKEVGAAQLIRGLRSV